MKISFLKPDFKSGHLIKKSEILKIRKDLPRDVVCYLDKLFSKKEAAEKLVRRKNIGNGIKDTKCYQDSNEVLFGFLKM